MPIRNKIKVLLHGREVGKTSLFDRYISDIFYASNPLKFPEAVDEKLENNGTVKIRLRDRFIPLEDKHYKSASVHILLFDMTKPNPLLDLSNTLLKIKEANKDRKRKQLIYLVGTKADLIANTATLQAEMALFSESNQLTGFKITSAKKNRGIKELFADIATTYVKNKKEDEAAEDVKKQLIIRLKAYVTRIESHTIATPDTNSTKINFAYNFSIFYRKSRALNREINYLLAKEIIKRLEKNSISEAFSDVNKIRDEIIDKNNFLKNKDFVSRGINSDELNAIIDDGENVVKNSPNLRFR